MWLTQQEVVFFNVRIFWTKITFTFKHLYTTVPLRLITYKSQRYSSIDIASVNVIVVMSQKSQISNRAFCVSI